ncbi:MAG: Gfo/Idh/MocA family oxidoreductase [Rhizobiales bacterium]|nr:Gfo/Idh/MocA family oxidoreductase [Hyphomicrobiales bacterium]
MAVVGAGLIGRRHVEAILRSDAAWLASIVDPDPAAAALAGEHGTQWHETISGMLAGDPPDGVIIATPNQMHVDHGLECVRAGLPILIEKPIADSAGSAMALVNQAEGKGIAVLVGHHRRHNPIIKAARAQIASGAIGDIVAAQATCWLYKPDDYFNVAWRTLPGAGPVLINLIHDIDLLRHFIGEVQSVQAVASNTTRGHDVEDTAAIILKFAGGALATVTVSDTIVAPWSWELTAAENPAYPETGQNCYFIGGTRGSIEIPAGTIWSQDGERSWWQPINHTTSQVEHRDPLDVQIDHFCEVITGKAEPLVSGREAVRSLQVIEAITEAARTGTVVCLE